MTKIWKGRRFESWWIHEIPGSRKLPKKQRQTLEPKLRRTHRKNLALEDLEDGFSIFVWWVFADQLKLTQGAYTQHFRKQHLRSDPAGRSRLFRLRGKRPHQPTVTALQWHPLRLLRIPRGCRQRNSRKSLSRLPQSMLSKKRTKSWRRLGSIEICGSKIDLNLKCLWTRWDWDTFGIFWILAVSEAPLRQRYRLCLRL